MGEIVIGVLRQTHNSLFPVNTMVVISCKIMRANFATIEEVGICDCDTVFYIRYDLIARLS